MKNISYALLSASYSLHFQNKNNVDTIPFDLLKCASTSTNTIIQRGMKDLLDDLESSRKSSYKRRGKRTVITEFRSQLNVLMETIQGTKTRYIRW